MQDLRSKTLAKTFFLLCLFASLLLLVTQVQDYARDCRRQAWDHLSPEKLSALVSHGEASVSCQRKAVDVTNILVLVHSSIPNHDNRNVIRQHAASIKSVTVIFVVGRAEHAVVPTAVEEELRSHKDILIGPFTDSYFNLTYKHLYGLSWAQKHCFSLDFVVKMDDDIVANFREIVRFVDKVYPVSTDPFMSRTTYNMIAGYEFPQMRVIRSSEDKWCTKRNEFSADFYPNFCSGWGYITTPETIDTLLSELQTIESAFWIDDVFVTGVLRIAARDVFLDPLNERYSIDQTMLKNWATGNESCVWDKLFSSADGTETQKQAYARIATQKSYWVPCSRVKKASTGNPQVREVRLG